ncbi:MAG TPA: tRNA dihydrouridine synthase DusB [Candidatus Cloacimonadota bacterium]|nr:tRNA dihydrouridine synthase DusB [Candidatus Cloacimonadota bacterium]
MVAELASIASQKLWLAPLAGFTDNAFRTVCKDCGADVVVSEMISADGLVFNEEKSLQYAKFEQQQRPFGIQLFGSDPLMMQKGAEIILPLQPDFIDLNMGCPVKKVVKRGAGSALMQTPEIAVAIVKAVKALLKKTPVLLTVKIRAGWDKQSINALDFGLRMEEAGADLICLHPRTRSQMFGGSSDWDLIRQLKEKLAIPLVGNGDITEVESALDMFTQTGCDAIMLGRGVLGQPWIFTQIKAAMHSHQKAEILPETKLEIIKKHLELSCLEKGEGRATTELRAHLAYYTKGYNGGAKVRNFINHSQNPHDMFDMISQLYLERGQDE